jgi:hypothetical protein
MAQGFFMACYLVGNQYLTQKAQAATRNAGESWRQLES